MAHSKETQERLFWKSVRKDATTGCWNWQGYLNKDGYGRTRLGGKYHLAHRYAYELFENPIPKGLTIDHLCRNRACVNPDHLEVVTTQENTRRGEGVSAVNARKTHCKRGHSLSGDNLKIQNGHRICLTCQALAYKKRRKGGLLEELRKKYANLTPEEKAARSEKAHAYYEDHREEAIERSRKSQQAHREERKAYMRQYYKDHPEKWSKRKG